MGKPSGFLEFPRRGPRPRPVAVRRRDWAEVYEEQTEAEVREQAARCMDCGIPFCTQGCPLGNPIPVFNDAAYRGRWADAAAQLLATNNFPEFTGRLCPAPCESACVLGISDDPVTIERLEYQTAEHAFALGLPVMVVPRHESGYHVAVVGSGPAGLAAAAQLRSVGHRVTVYERADALGGLLRYGIPAFKLDKAILERRLAVLRDAGVEFRPSSPVGPGGLALADLERRVDAVVLALGATVARELPIAGSDLAGVHLAMTYLEAANRAVAADRPPAIDARDRAVLILGGGDTGADCLGTAHRQGARSVTQLEILPEPPTSRPADQPWPTMPRLLKVTSAHEEGGTRRFAIDTLAFEGPAAAVARARLRDVTTGAEEVVDADLVLVAAGFLGPDLAALGVPPHHATPRSTIAVTDTWRTGLGASAPVFACGDAVRGQSLIVWAIAEGRSAAAAVDQHLTGQRRLPAPVRPQASSW
ncbi:MAG: glutamate synthase subunit beta [Acidimicrobiales bacterium]